MIYKTNDSIIVIQTEAINPIQTGVVFWSYDRGTAKLRFKLQKDGVSQNLPEGTTVPIRLVFQSPTAQGGYGKHDYLATIEDRLNGIVSIVLEDNILGYQGKVEGSIYINFPNDQSLDTAGRFSFAIKRSPIDETVPELEDYYFNGFEQINKKQLEIKDKIDAFEKKITETASSVVNNISESVTSANANIEAATKTATETIDELANEVIENIDSTVTNIQASANEVLNTIKENNIYTKQEADSEFVNLTEPQSIDGTKNFLQTPMIGGKTISTALDDTGWIDLKLADGFEVAEDNPPQYKIIYRANGDNDIKYRGEFQQIGAVKFTKGTSYYPFGRANHDLNIPIELKPDKTAFGYAATDTGVGGRLSITESPTFVFIPGDSDSTYCAIDLLAYTQEKQEV